MGQDQDSGVARLNAFLVWMTNGLTHNTEQMLDWLERFMADPGMERYRLLFETYVGLLPNIQMYVEGCAWGVARNNQLWVKVRYNGVDTFDFRGTRVQGTELKHAVRNNLVVVWNATDPECDVIFKYVPAELDWVRYDIPEGDRVVVVREDSVLLFTPRSSTMMRREGNIGYSVVREERNIGEHRILLEVPNLNGVKAGEDWLVAWSRVDTTLTVHLVSGDHRESIEVGNSTGNPTVFAPTTIGGMFVNVTIAVETLGNDKSWLCGTRLFVVRHDESEVVVNAFYIAGNRWQWNRVRGHPYGRSVGVNSTWYREFRYVKALEPKGNVVCVLDAHPDRIGTYADDTLHVIAPNGSKLGSIQHISEHRDATPLAQWPLVRHRTEGYRYVQMVDTEDMVSIKIDTLSGYMFRKGEWLFCVRGNELTAYSAATQRVGALEEPIGSLRGRKLFLANTAVVSDKGQLFCAMQRSEKWVVVIGPRGQYGHDYHEVRDIAVDDGFVTFNGRVDHKVVRVRIPL